jgi:hypothetical protein
MIPKPLANGCGGRKLDPALAGVFEQILKIVIRRSMAKQNPRLDNQGGRQTREPGFVPRLQHCKCGPIRRAHRVHRTIQQLTVMIAADVQVVLAHQDIGHSRGFERSREMISQIDDQVRRTFSQIRLDGF